MDAGRGRSLGGGLGNMGLLLVAMLLGEDQVVEEGDVICVSGSNAAAVRERGSAGN